VGKVGNHFIPAFLGGLCAVVFAAGLEYFFVDATVVGPVIEELCKLLAVIVLFTFFVNDNPVWLAVGVSLGFVFVEIVFVMASVVPGVLFWDLLAFRILYPGLLHLCSGVVASLGLRSNQNNKVVLTLLCLVIAVSLHIVLNVVLYKYSLIELVRGI
jgi:RsiW-degrading membrane proteinase PrsW (M82 family)